jgi:hypothetical protein
MVRERNSGGLLTSITVAYLAAMAGICAADKMKHPVIMTFGRSSPEFVCSSHPSSVGSITCSLS